jgi:hypothetical protein
MIVTNDIEKKKRLLLQGLMKHEGFDVLVELADKMVFEFKETGSITQDTMEQSALHTAKFEGRRLGITELFERLQGQAFNSQ